MGWFNWLCSGSGHGVDELTRRLGFRKNELRDIQPEYHDFSIPKRSGGTRRISAPNAELKDVQRRILRRLLTRLKVHPAAMGFEPGRSIVTNARAHQGQAVVLRFDLVDFFGSTTAQRVERYFRKIGWNRPATQLLLRLCTHEGTLPQGAPTSPRLSNLVNFRLDARLAGMAAKLGGVYTRYADDLTISFAEIDPDRDDNIRVNHFNPRTGMVVETDQPMTVKEKIGCVSRFVGWVARAEGYRVHRRKKRSVRWRHDCQTVTGLVVNERVQLPRATRRWLRAVEHRTRLAERASHEPLSHERKEPTLTPSQLEGWRAFQTMVERQAAED